MEYLEKHQIACPRSTAVKSSNHFVPFRDRLKMLFNNSQKKITYIFQPLIYEIQNRW